MEDYDHDNFLEGYCLEKKKRYSKGDKEFGYIVEQMIENEIEQNPQVNGFIFDGFPRTISQAERLDSLLSGRGQEVTKVISIIIDDKLVFDRIHHRASIEGRMDDTNAEIIQNRIDTYHRKTEPLIEYYKGCDKYFEIDGNGKVEDIFDKISNLIAE